MIRFKSARYKNFFSSGNQETYIELDKHATTLVVGKNGVGKSTFADVICFALYKKTFRPKINLDTIVNTINNGDCFAEVVFEKGTHEYIVRRGLKPAFFELLIDGEPRKQLAAQKDDQAYLVEDILQVKFDSFIQVVILGNARYTPFMQLEKAKRRLFIEHILDIGIFSVMNKVLKDRMDDTKADLSNYGVQLTSTKEQIGLIEGFIKKLEAEKKKASIDVKSQIRDQEIALGASCVEIDGLAAQIDELKATITDEPLLMGKVRALEAEHNKLNLEKQRLRTKAESDLKHIEQEKATFRRSIEAIRERIKIYKQTELCNTCGQDITEAHRNKIVIQELQEIIILESQIEKCDPKIATIKTETTAAYQQNKKQLDDVAIRESEHQGRKEEIEVVNEEIAELQTKIREKTVHQKSITTFIDKLKADLKKEPGNIQEQVDKLAQTNVKLSSIEQDKKDALELQQLYSAAAVMLKDTGIKAAIIKQYMPSLNKLVNRYLAALDFFVTFSLDEEFDETIKINGVTTLGYYNFSQGQKLRIDLALLFAWREIAKQKNSCATNLLILDETLDASLDADGTDLFIRFLQTELNDTNVFIISHKSDAAMDKFEHCMRFALRKSFSVLVDENLQEIDTKQEVA